MEDKDLIDLTEYFDRLYKGLLKLYKIGLALIVLMALVNVTKTMITYRPMYKSSMTVVVSEQDKNIFIHNYIRSCTVVYKQSTSINKKRRNRQFPC